MYTINALPGFEEFRPCGRIFSATSQGSLRLHERLASLDLAMNGEDCALARVQKWLADLTDTRVRIVVAIRVRRLSQGLFGDAKFFVAPGVHELRIDIGAGWRVYFTQRAGRVVVLLAGGSKRTQKRDLQEAAELAATLDKAGEHYGKPH